MGGKNRNDIVSGCPKVRLQGFFLCEAGKGRGLEVLPVFPGSDRNNTAADSGRRTVSSVSVRISCRSDDDNACLPETFHGFFQRKIDSAVIGADGKIHYSDIIFAGIVHYPSEGAYGLCRVSLTGSVQNFDGNNMHMRCGTAPDAMRKKAVSAGYARDVSHGSKDAEEAGIPCILCAFAVK